MKLIRQTKKLWESFIFYYYILLIFINNIKTNFIHNKYFIIYYIVLIFINNININLLIIVNILLFILLSDATISSSVASCFESIGLGDEQVKSIFV